MEVGPSGPFGPLFQKVFIFLPIETFRYLGPLGPKGTNGYRRGEHLRRNPHLIVSSQTQSDLSERRLSSNGFQNGCHYIPFPSTSFRTYS